MKFQDRVCSRTKPKVVSIESKPSRAVWKACLFAILILVLVHVHGEPTFAAGDQESTTSDAHEVWETFTNRSEISSLSYDEKRKLLWIGTSGGALMFDTSTYQSTHYTSDAGLASNVINDVLVDGQFVWFATPAGLTRRSYDGEWHTFTQANSELVNDEVSSISRGDEGLWIGTGAGLSLMRSQSEWERFTKESTGGGLATDELQIVLAQGHELWVGTWNGGLIHRNIAGTWTQYSSESQPSDGNSLTSNNVRALALDQADGLWIGSLGRWDQILQQWFPGAASRFSPLKSTWSPLTTNDGLIHEFINDIAAVSDGSMWIATEGGLTRHSNVGQRVKNYGLFNGLPEIRVRAVEDGDSDHIWIGTATGLVRYLKRDESFTPIPLVPSEIASASVNALADDAKQMRLWTGTQDGSSYIETDHSIRQVELGQGRPQRWINDVAIDPESGTAWHCSGIYDPSFAAAQQFVGGGLSAVGESDTMLFNHLLESQGLANDLCFTAEIDPGSRELWVGTWDGVSRVQLGAGAPSDAQFIDPPLKSSGALIEESGGNQIMAEEATRYLSPWLPMGPTVSVQNSPYMV